MLSGNLFGSEHRVDTLSLNSGRNSNTRLHKYVIKFIKGNEVFSFSSSLFFIRAVYNSTTRKGK